MAIYTRGGDSGMTSLRDGERVSKGSLQVAVLGELDELNCNLGFGAAVVGSLANAYRELGYNLRADDLKKIVKQLQLVQEEILELGANVANTKLQSGRNSSSGRVETLEHKGTAAPTENNIPEANKWLGRVVRLEEGIDAYNKSLPDLKNFILPGGGVGAGSIHVCRVVLRRCERTMTRLVQMQGGRTQIVGEFALGWLPYLNRLGDWLFMLARWTAWVCEEREQVWRGDKSQV